MNRINGGVYSSIEEHLKKTSEAGIKRKECKTRIEISQDVVVPGIPCSSLG